MNRIVPHALRVLLAAALLALLGFALPTAASAEILSTRADIIRALELHTEQGDLEYELTLTADLLADVKAGMEDGWFNECRSNSGIQSFHYRYNERDNTFELSNIEYRVAVRIWQAYRQGNIGALTARERQTLDYALEIVQNAPADPAAREQYLHDTLCANVEYYTDNESYAEKDQAIGALLNGQADCDGYSEGFYLLCNLAGIPARFQHGDTLKKEPGQTEVKHMWNLIRLYDTWVMVDVTWDDLKDDAGCCYLYYNIGAKRAAETHIWDREAMAVAWADVGGNIMRPSGIVETHVDNMESAEAWFHDCLVNRLANHVAVTFADGMDFDRDSEIVGSWIYSTGVKDYMWKTGGHCAEFVITGWYDEYRVVSSEEEALAYVDEMRAQGKTEFNIMFEKPLGPALFADDLAGYYLLEGQFGLDEHDMHYSKTGYSASYENVTYDEYFRVCPTQDDVLRFVEEMKASGVSRFSFCIPGEYGCSLLENDLAGYRLLEGRFGMDGSSNMRYYQQSQKFIYSNAAFASHFRVCASEADILSYLNDMAYANVSGFSFHIPGQTGASLFANQLQGVRTLLYRSLLNDWDLTYSEDSQTVYIKNATYWSSYNYASPYDLFGTARSLLSSQPRAITIWTDGTFTWNQSLFEQMTLAARRQGVETFRYNIYEERLELTDINYRQNVGLINSEDELMSFLRSCRANNLTSFNLFFTEDLYASLSANNFKRFLSLTSSVLNNANELRYSEDYYLISMSYAQFKR